MTSQVAGKTTNQARLDSNTKATTYNTSLRKRNTVDNSVDEPDAAMLDKQSANEGGSGIYEDWNNRQDIMYIPRSLFGNPIALDLCFR